jgi:hypothetical protein
MLAYWNFFPAAEGWGRIPVWGFADVIGSRHPEVAEGTRVFGYVPMSTHLTVRPGAVARSGFADTAPHRSGLSPVYNHYIATAMDPGYAREHEDQLMLFRPLFVTAFLLDDFLAHNAFFGARAVMLSSASSKTAFSTAFLLSKRQPRCEIIGLTSAGNRKFVEGLGCYDRVSSYEEIAALPRQPTVFIDMAGDSRVVGAVHHHFGDDLKHSGMVGMTHWEERGEAQALPGPPPTLFFAPTHLEQRTAEWGASGFQQRYGDAWRRFLEFSRDVVRVVHGRGRAAVESVYQEMLAGRARPSDGHILTLWE